MSGGSKVFGCFIDVRKAFDTVWIDGLLFKLFSELGIKGCMWLVIRNLYTGVKAQVLYSGSLPRKFDILYKVYIIGLLNELTQHSCALSLNSVSLTPPSFANDISLLSIYPTFLSIFMNLCYAYCIKWRYEFNHVKSGIVTFGESKHMHSDAMKESTWVVSGESITELYEYKNLGVFKNYIGSFSTNADDNIDKTRKKADMLFSSNFGVKHASPLYCMVQNFLPLHLHFQLKLSVVSNGS